MAAILLRKLTKKSILGFGKYEDVAICNMLDMNYKSYLRWVYYNCSMITFVDDILDEINIKDKERFDKPGCNKELEQENKERISGNTGKFTKLKIATRKKKLMKKG